MPILKTLMSSKRVMLVCLVVTCIGSAFTSAPANLYLMLEGHNSYFVPKESSVWTFQPDVMNSGSGSWWLFGSDRDRFYALSSEKPEYYHILRRNTCTGFDSRKVETWCSHDTSSIPG